MMGFTREAIRKSALVQLVRASHVVNGEPNLADDEAWSVPVTCTRGADGHDVMQVRASRHCQLRDRRTTQDLFRTSRGPTTMKLATSWCSAARCAPSFTLLTISRNPPLHFQRYHLGRNSVSNVISPKSQLGKIRCPRLSHANFTPW